MKSLIEKLEAAKEGSRELDAEIKEKFVGFNPDNDLPKYWPMVGKAEPPPYTSSLDAAQTLVSERRRWSLHMFDDCCHASIWKIKERPFESTANTPALALCIAALKAQEA